MDASDGAQISPEPPGAAFLLAPPPAPIPNTAFCGRRADLRPPSHDMDAESFCTKSLLTVEEQLAPSRMKRMVDERYLSSSFLAAGDGVAVSCNAAADGSNDSRGILLSCSTASARVKKKRRSRASNKAPTKVFSADTSNFMAMVHKLTGISSSAPPFHSTLPSLWPPTSKILPFNQGLPTFDTSMLHFPTLSDNTGLSGSGFSGLQPLPTQQHGSFSSSLKNSGQAAQLQASMDGMPTSYSELVRSMSSSYNSSSLPRLWDDVYTNQKSAALQLPQNVFSENECLLNPKASHQETSREVNCPASSTLSGFEMLLAGQDKLSSSISAPISCITKEELL